MEGGRNAERLRVRCGRGNSGGVERGWWLKGERLENEEETNGMATPNPPPSATEAQRASGVGPRNRRGRSARSLRRLERGIATRTARSALAWRMTSTFEAPRPCSASFLVWGIRRDLLARHRGFVPACSAFSVCRSPSPSRLLLSPGSRPSCPPVLLRAALPQWSIRPPTSSRQDRSRVPSAVVAVSAGGGSILRHRFRRLILRCTCN